MQRAAHQLLDEPRLFDDPRALEMVGHRNAAEITAHGERYRSPIAYGLRAAVVVRSVFAEAQLHAAVARGVRQYLLLGSGLDTFAFRNPYPELKVFEVDHPATQQFKEGLVAEAGWVSPPNRICVHTDFEQMQLLHSLAAAGFDARAPCCISWLGVTMYLRPDVFARMLACLASLAPGTSLVFDYLLDRQCLALPEQVRAEELRERVAAAGEPWLGFFEPGQLQARLCARGFSIEEDLGAEALNARYFAGRTDGMRLSGISRLLHVRLGLTAP